MNISTIYQEKKYSTLQPICGTYVYIIHKYVQQKITKYLW
jgi:hypothetical protein